MSNRPSHPDTAFRVIVVILTVLVMSALIWQWVHSTPPRDDSAWAGQR
ncbi:MAG TPA: hypothetical protein VIM69_13800 [Opitutaceae bacterium]